MPCARVAFALLVAASTLFVGSRAVLAQDAPSPAEASPAEAERRTPERNQIVLSGDVLVRRGEDVGEVVVFHGTATIAGVVHGDVVMIDGRIEVTGQVSGSVVAVHGPISIGPNAQILGDVIGRNRLQIAEGARVDGDVRRGTAFTFRTPIDAFGPFAAWLAIAVSTLFLGGLLVLLAPRGLEASAAAALGSPWASAGIGLVVAIGLPVLAVFGVVSLVGLPFGLGLLLALAFVYSIAFVSSVFILGRAIWRAPRSRWLAFAIGWSIVLAASAIPFVGGVLWIVGAPYGLGALTVASWRARGTGGRHRPGGKMPSERTAPRPTPRPEPALKPEPTRTPEPQPMITERAMEQEGTGI